MLTSPGRSEEALRWLARHHASGFARMEGLRKLADRGPGKKQTYEAELAKVVAAYERHLAKGVVVPDQKESGDYDVIEGSAVGFPFAVTRARANVRMGGLPTVCDEELQRLMKLAEVGLPEIVRGALVFKGVFPESFVRKVRWAAEDQQTKEA